MGDAERAQLIEDHLPLVNHVVLQVAVRFPRYVDRHELARAGALDLVDKTFAAGRPVLRRRFRERAMGIAKLGDEIIVPPPGPRAKILFAKIGLLDRIEPKRQRALARAARRATNGKRFCRQFCPQRGKGRDIAEIGRRIGSMNDAARSIDRGVPNQPEIGFGAHARPLRQPCREQQQDRGFRDLLGPSKHVAGLAADLPLGEPGHESRAEHGHQRGPKRTGP